MRFGTIRNNTALKRGYLMSLELRCFGTIRNNTALKPAHTLYTSDSSFGTIRNNTALKPLHLNLYVEQVLEPFETTQL